MMAVASDLPDLENRKEYQDARNSVARGRPAASTLGVLTNNQSRVLVRYERHLAVHAQRDHRHRGPPLLRELGRRRARHRPRARPGRAQPQGGAGRLDHRPAVRQERAARAVRPHGVPEDARGRAGLPPHAQVAQEQDPHAVPELDLLRQRRLRRRVRGAHVLRQPARPPGLRHARPPAVREGPQARGGRADRRRGRQPDAPTTRSPIPQAAQAPAQPRAQEHVRPGAARRAASTSTPARGAAGAGRHQAADACSTQGAVLHDLGAPAARRPVRRAAGLRGRPEGPHDARPRPPGRRPSRRSTSTCPTRTGRRPRVVAIDNDTGEVRAMVGGRDYAERAVQPRHAGPAPAGLVDQAVHPRRRR